MIETEFAITVVYIEKSCLVMIKQIDLEIVVCVGIKQIIAMVS